jgi:hypothetical protein
MACPGCGGSRAGAVGRSMARDRSGCARVRLMSSPVSTPRPASRARRATVYTTAAPCVPNRAPRRGRGGGARSQRPCWPGIVRPRGPRPVRIVRGRAPAGSPVPPDVRAFCNPIRKEPVRAAGEGPSVPTQEPCRQDHRSGIVEGGSWCQIIAGSCYQGLTSVSKIWGRPPRSRKRSRQTFTDSLPPVRMAMRPISISATRSPGSAARALR